MNNLGKPIALVIQAALYLADRIARLRIFHTVSNQSPGINKSVADEIAVIIPERDSDPVLFEACLQHLQLALENIAIPAKVIVFVNGCEPEQYNSFISAYPRFTWIFEPQPTGFASSIRLALEHVHQPWVYLLNSDMILNSNALSTLLLWRDDQIFGLSSQIFFHDSDQRREETGLTGLVQEQGEWLLHDIPAKHYQLPMMHLYAGGGASLFNTCALKKVLKGSWVYDPAYCEDLEWGIKAAQLGLMCLFVPESFAFHKHRATLSRFYTEDYIEQLLNRNFQHCKLRNLPNLLNIREKFQYILQLLYMPNPINRLLSLFSVHLTYPQAELALTGTGVDRFILVPPITTDERPWILWVSPFSLLPGSHGSAIRQRSMLSYLSKNYRIHLIMDEGWDCKINNLHQLAGVSSVSRINQIRHESQVPDNENDTRMQRMVEHGHELIRMEIKRMSALLKPILVQVEHEELCDLVSGKPSTTPWFITLHDVYGQGPDSSLADQYLRKRLQQFDKVFCCTDKDQETLRRPPSIVVENGVDLARFSPYSPSQGYSLLLITPFRYKPNYIGVLEFLSSCYKTIFQAVDDLTITILGGDSGPSIQTREPLLQQPGITVLPSVTHVPQLIQQSLMTINPVKNVRGSCLKTIESLAAGRICISTREAAIGYTQSDYENLIIVDNFESMSTRVIELIHDHKLRHSLEKPDMEKLQQYDWQKLARKQQQVYSSVLQDRQ